MSIGPDLEALGLTSGAAARLLATSERNIRRWRAETKDAGATVTEFLAILRQRPGALDALRDEYDPTDADAGSEDAPEMVRRLQWLRARFPA